MTMESDGLRVCCCYLIWKRKKNSSLSNMEKKLDSFIKSFARERTTSAGTKRQLEMSQQQRQKKPHREAPPLGEGMQDATHP